MPSSTGAVLLLLVSLLAIALASDSDHKYQADEQVTLWVNKVGPYNNPQETYNYFSLPFCRPSQNDVHKWGGLGEVLGGNELIDSEIPIKFLKNVDRNVICKLELDEAKVKHFKDAIESSYWFEFFMDDLPLWGFVGELHSDKNGENAKHVLYTHKNIVVKYNKDQIIHVNLTQDNPRPLEAGRTVDLTYSVQWIPTDITFPRRFDVYLDYPFFEHQIHWFSIFNSFMMCMVLTASLFPFLCFGIGFLLNTIAIFYGSLAAIPFGTMVVVFVIWGFISFPLALLGTVVGRNWSGAPNNPCRVKTIPRPIPEKKWYLTPSVVSLMGGLLPFGSIFIEMYFVFTSFWNYKVYYVYGFMLLVFVILVIVTVCVTIVGTYFLLNAENYHWQWTSFFSAASTAVYVYLYSIYYYYVKTKMSGFFQTSFYFGYTMMFCLGLGILCGAVGFLGSNLFVRRIYRNIKCD
ncbi:hypothetical protein BRARA_I05199 [Brassica rapa]|uniref:Transmembrane 9 superfamily member n=1 Tax=Brassica campestris TaxID=3711 RepID=A0A397Y6A2_BRACM|nr:hypothetical protein BRARA_I05199 [Brassica rapa]